MPAFVVTSALQCNANKESFSGKDGAFSSFLQGRPMKYSLPAVLLSAATKQKAATMQSTAMLAFLVAIPRVRRAATLLVLAWSLVEAHWYMLQFAQIACTLQRICSMQLRSINYEVANL